MRFAWPVLVLLMSLAVSSSAVRALTADGVARATFRLSVDHESLRARRAHISITVPAEITVFEAPTAYGGAPMFIQYLSELRATDGQGDPLPVAVRENKVTIESSAAEGDEITLAYTYNVPQSIAGEVDLSLPTLDESHGRFDNNLTFLAPVGPGDMPAELIIDAPREMSITSSWGSRRSHKVRTMSGLIGGMIVLGDYRHSTYRVKGRRVTFAIRGRYDDDLLKEQFLEVLESQCEIVGTFPAPRLLVVFQDTVAECCKGTSLTNALIVNIPSDTALDPFNFVAVGTMSHELFHQWNLRLVGPADEEGAYLLTEGFTNYFAVAALVHAGLVPQERFARFLWRYRALLESNPRYPGATYSAINSGFEVGDDDLSSLAYQKGPLVAVLLDRALREDTDGAQSLTTWFRALIKEYRSKGYHVADLRSLTVRLSGKAEGEAVRVFDRAFIGGEALALDELFTWLGIVCSPEGVCVLSPLPAPQAERRQKIFSAEP